jgi:hypothetical protein
MRLLNQIEKGFKPGRRNPWMSDFTKNINYTASRKW